MVAGVGFFTDAYDIFAISIASTMLGYAYGNSIIPNTRRSLFTLAGLRLTMSSELRALDANQDLGIKVATPVGTLVGQLLFGWLADIVGRKRMCKFLPFALWAVLNVTLYSFDT